MGSLLCPRVIQSKTERSRKPNLGVKAAEATLVHSYRDNNWCRIPSSALPCPIGLLAGLTWLAWHVPHLLTWMWRIMLWSPVPLLLSQDTLCWQGYSKSVCTLTTSYTGVRWTTPPLSRVALPEIRLLKPCCGILWCVKSHTIKIVEDQTTTHRVHQTTEFQLVSLNSDSHTIPCPAAWSTTVFELVGVRYVPRC